MPTTPNSVISGVRYPVASVAGRPATVLAQFLGETGFTVELAGDEHLVHGTGSGLHDCVRFHEKDPILGRDVRVWHVVETDDGFAAEHVAAF